MPIIDRHAPPTDWPPLMRAATAAAYCDETSVQAFRRAVGTLYPRPRIIKGKGERWLREDLDQAIAAMTGQSSRLKDASAVL